MAQMEQQLPLPMPDLSTLRISTAVSMLGKAYGCGQCSGKRKTSVSFVFEHDKIISNVPITKNYIFFMM